MKKIITSITLSILIFSSGCQMVSIMGSPTRHERKIPAEYDFASKQKEKVLVVVDSAAWSDVPFDLKKKLVDALNAGLNKKLKLNKKNIIDYKNEKDFLQSKGEPSASLPYDIGKKAGADLLCLYCRRS